MFSRDRVVHFLNGCERPDISEESSARGDTRRIDWNCSEMGRPMPERKEIVRANVLRADASEWKRNIGAAIPQEMEPLVTNNGRNELTRGDDHPHGSAIRQSGQRIAASNQEAYGSATQLTTDGLAKLWFVFAKLLLMRIGLIATQLNIHYFFVNSTTMFWIIIKSVIRLMLLSGLP